MKKQATMGMLSALTLVLSSMPALASSVNGMESGNYAVYDYATKTEAAYQAGRPYTQYHASFSGIYSSPPYIPDSSGAQSPAGGESIAPCGWANNHNPPLTETPPTSFPCRTVVYLACGWDTDNDGRGNEWYDGSGFMQGCDVEVTAAHCYWSTEKKKWAAEVKTYAYVNGSVGSTFYYPQTWVYSTDYTNNGNYQYDWCVVTLQNNLGCQTGWLGRTTGAAVGTAVTASGYPGGSSCQENPWVKYHHQYSDTGSITSADDYSITYSANVLAGDSGGPVYTSENYACAISTYLGYNSSAGTYFSQGNRITWDLFNIIQTAYENGRAKWHG